MKFALCFLALVAYAHAIPITKKDVRTETAPVATPAIVGSSQVDRSDDKQAGRVTLHLDQRSEIIEPTKPVVSVPQTVEPVKSVSVAEEPKQEPILTARNDIVAPPKPEEPIRRVDEPAVDEPVRTVLDSRNEIIPSQPARESVPETPIVRQVEPQVVERPVIVVEEVPRVVVPVIPPQPAIIVPVETPVGERDVPQQVVQPVIVPEVPQTIVEPVEVRPIIVVSTPVLEERSTPVVQTSPIASDVPARDSDVSETKIVPKQVETSEARNLKVDEAPVRAPIVVSAIQKQTPVAEVKSEIQPQKQVIPQESRLEAKNAIVPEIKSETSRVEITPQVQEPKVVIEERKPVEAVREQVKPEILAESVSVSEPIVRNEPVVPQVVQPQESSIRTETVREPVQVEQVKTIEPLVVSQEAVRREPVVVSVVRPQETNIRPVEIVVPVQTARLPEIREPVRVETAPVASTRPVVSPVVQSEQIIVPTTEIRHEPVKIQSTGEKTQ